MMLPMTGRMTDEEMMVQYKSHIAYRDAKIAHLEADNAALKRATGVLSAEDANLAAEALQEATNLHDVQQKFGGNPYYLTNALRIYANALADIQESE